VKGEVLVDGVAFPECPRWRDGCLWFSDQHSGQVFCLDAAGGLVHRIDVPGRAAGLGWLPDGRLLVASMEQRRLYVMDAAQQLQVYADLASVHHGQSNDMVVDASGNAYVGNIGFDFNGGEEPRETNVAMVRPDGAVSVAARDMLTPNGSVITPDGATLIVAESLANRLTSFSIGSDGALAQRSVWAQLGDHVPDGICLDAQGCIWLASPYAGQVLRVQQGGAVLQRLDFGEAQPYACMLGGDDGCTLYVCLAPHHDPAVTLSQRAGSVQAVRVDVAHAGLP
tara:strand:+ start:176 stop:1021 length:846 start_codon:yes stop_codon:yes gene_type:complete